MKGDLRSAPREILLNEARSLLDQGVRELNLVAQDISVYGADRWRAYRLPDLLRDLCSLNGDFWVRCLYCYPGGVTDALLEALAGDPKIVPYLDIPLQHLDPEMLRRMKRPSHTINTVKLVERLRKAIPNLTLRTTVMVGFPGETPQAFRRLLDGLRALAFDRLGVFQYSREEGTPAAAMRRQVGKAVKEKRWHAVMELQAQISARLNRRRIGTRTRVLIEGYEAQRHRWVGRSSAEAPEVDGNVLVAGAKPLCPGQLVTVEITETETYDLMGRVIAE
jgi:ribosomal protein S12 methylthiotransferase